METTILKGSNSVHLKKVFSLDLVTIS